LVFRDHLAEASVAEDAERLPRKLMPGEKIAVPVARMGACNRRRQLPHARDEQPPRQLCRRGEGIEQGVFRLDADDLNAPPAGEVEVNVVRAGRRRGDCAEPCPPFDDGPIYADVDVPEVGVVAGDDLDERVVARRQVGHLRHLFERGLRFRVGRKVNQAENLELRHAGITSSK